jgi:hypothetical protein
MKPLCQHAADSRNRFEQRHRIRFTAQSVQHRQAPCRYQSPQRRRQPFTDSSQPAQAFIALLAPDFGQGFWQTPNAGRSVAI